MAFQPAFEAEIENPAVEASVKTSSVSILDYGVGNLGSVQNMFRHIGVETELITSPEQVVESKRVLLPGVGAFDHAMRKLSERNLDTALRDRAAIDRPTLGICLGMQILMDFSEEGNQAGLGLIAGHLDRFQNDGALKVPHMGWNTISDRREHPLLTGLKDESRFYFVHSFRAICENQENVIATSSYGVEFPSVIGNKLTLGAQFHPEKSHRFGMTLLNNFASL